VHYSPLPTKQKKKKKKKENAQSQLKAFKTQEQENRKMRMDIWSIKKANHKRKLEDVEWKEDGHIMAWKRSKWEYEFDNQLAHRYLEGTKDYWAIDVDDLPGDRQENPIPIPPDESQWEIPEEENGGGVVKKEEPM
jgi:hypothetical protein